MHLFLLTNYQYSFIAVIKNADIRSPHVFGHLMCETLFDYTPLTATDVNQVALQSVDHSRQLYCLLVGEIVKLLSLEVKSLQFKP